MKPLPLISAALLLLYGVLRRRRHGRVALAAGALVVAALAVYGLGLVHPPSAERVLREVGSRLGAWTYVVVGVLAFLETGAFIGLISPGETVILFGGVVAGQGRIDVVALIAVVWSCAVAGDLASYALGRRLGREFLVRHGPRLKITPERLEHVEDLFARRGGTAVFLGRFVGLLRAVLPFVAGASRLGLRRFVAFDALSAGLWGGGLVLLGYAFWGSFDAVLAVVHQGLLAIGAAIALGAAAAWAVRVARDPERRAAVRRALDGVPAGGVVIVLGRFVLRVASSPRALEVAALGATALGGAVAYGMIAHAVGAPPTALDSSAFDVASSIDGGAAVSAAKVVSAFGDARAAGAALLLAVVWLLIRRRPALALALLLAGVLDEILFHALKADVGRPRPAHALVSTVGSSFPSGHAAQAVAWIAAALALARDLGRARGPAIAVAAVLTIAIGISRVLLRAHYLTDVLAGWALGAAVFAAAGLAAVLVGHLRHNVRSP